LIDEAFEVDLKDDFAEPLTEEFEDDPVTWLEGLTEETFGDEATDDLPETFPEEWDGPVIWLEDLIDEALGVDATEDFADSVLEEWAEVL
jgi:hypothetical protein